MGSVQRRRTRSQWDEYYLNYYNEMKGKKSQEDGGVSDNVVDCESIVGGKCKEKQDCVVIQQSESSQVRDFKRTKNVGHEFSNPKLSNDNNIAVSPVRVSSCSDDDVEYLGQEFANPKLSNDNNIAVSPVRVPSCSDEDVEYLGEEVVSNGSSLKIGQESRSGSGLKVSNLDEVVSCINEEFEETKTGADDGISIGLEGKIKTLDDENLPRDVSIDVEKFTGSGGSSSTKSLDVSDNSVDDLSDNSFDSDSDSTSEEEEDFSDEDYNVDESSTSDDHSDVSYDSVDRDKDDEYDTDCSDILVNEEENDSFNSIHDEKRLDTLTKTKRMSEKEESDDKLEADRERDERNNGDDDDDGSKLMKRHTNQERDEDVVIIINDNGESPSVRKRTRMSGKKESDREDREICDGYHRTEDNKKRVEKKKKANVAITGDDEKKLPSIRNGPRNYGFMDEASKDGDNNGTNVRKEAIDEINKSVLKKRKVLGLEIPIDSDTDTNKEDRNSPNSLRPRAMKKQELTKPENVEIPHDMDDEPKSREDEIRHVERVVERGEKWSMKKTRGARNVDLIKILMESINSLKDEKCPIEENDRTHETLPLKFRFEDEDEPTPEKSEWEKEMDALFHDLELGLRVSESDYDNSCVPEKDEIIANEIDKSPAACCSRREHEHVLDEQIGVVCKYCRAVIMDIKYVLPPFYVRPPRRRDWREYDESPSSGISQIHFQDSTCTPQDSTTHVKGTVWDLIPGVEKEMYPHQREGFEFIWKNIAGDISIEKLKMPLPEGSRGCIISHAPGTGKTRLTIVFLMTFLKMYPTCRPVIIAPRGMLLTWESEFIKWRANIPFHILNKNELSGDENAVAANILGQVGCGGMDTEYIRLVKLYSWMKGRSILGISYHLFEKLAGENGKRGQNEQIKKLLLESPGLLVLDEGHTPRNDQSLMWRALANVATPRRIILSGTPFQNNMNELFNTLCLVNPDFFNQIGSQNNISWCETRGRKSSMVRKKWMVMTSSIGKNRNNGLMKLKTMLDPFVHVHKGTILQERLLGLRDTLVFLHPTELQKTLLETASKAANIFHRIRLVSLVSVHPSLMPEKRRLSCDKSKLEEIALDIDAGVKTKFVMKLIWLADALNERVLVFSQYIDPLVYIKKQIMSQFSWSEGKQVLYMDGQLDEKQRQDSISSFNDDSSEAKVLFASERACSEGINLVGASRVVLLDTTWNPSVEKQAISRAYRLGQKRVVYVYRLFTSGTEVKQYAQQFKKEQISELIFSPGDGRKCEGDKSRVVSEDKILEAMVGLEGYSECFENIIHDPKESDIIEIFGWG